MKLFDIGISSSNIYNCKKGGVIIKGKITLILRGYNYEQVRTVAEVLCESKVIKNVEITLNTENAFEIIRKISEEFSAELFIGAGTVINYNQLVEAIGSGAKFVLSPLMMTKQMLDYCKEKKVISVPGAFTPTEIYESFQMGADIVKIFPANEVSMTYANKVLEPLGEYPLMAVGGVNKDNVKEILKSGYSYVGSAGGIFTKESIKTKDKLALKKQLVDFESSISNS